jgi:hypothetical protein
VIVVIQFSLEGWEEIELRGTRIKLKVTGFQLFFSTDRTRLQKPTPRDSGDGSKVNALLRWRYAAMP